MCSGSGMEPQLCTEVVLVTHPHSGLCPSHGSPPPPPAPSCLPPGAPAQSLLPHRFQGSSAFREGGVGGDPGGDAEGPKTDSCWCPVREGVGRLGVWGWGSGEAWGAWRSGMERS